jgi:ferredoxin-NADP reductase
MDSGQKCPFSTSLPLHRKQEQEEDEEGGESANKFVADITSEVVLFGIVICFYGGYNYFNPEFSTFKVVAKQNLSPSNSIITLRPDKSGEVKDFSKEWQSGLWSVAIKQPVLSISRLYQPLPPMDNDQTDCLRFLVHDTTDDGVSNYISKLWARAEIRSRKTRIDLEIPADVEKVVFLASGVPAIAPALQLIYTLLQARKQKDLTTVHLVWAIGKEEREEPPTILDNLFLFSGVPQNPVPSASKNIIAKELKKLQQKYPNHLSIELVDENSTYFDEAKLAQLTSIEATAQQPSTQGSKMLFISGSQEWVATLAGPENRDDSNEHNGRTGAVLDNVDLSAWKVYRLSKK